MPVMTETIAALSPLQRRMAEAWLTRFEENWHDQKLRECMRALPAQSTLRRPLLLAMIERDLSHQWDEGHRVGVEEYLKEFPELAEGDELPVELIAAEFKVSQKHGGVDFADFAERYPSRIDDLYALLKPSLFEGGSDPETPKIDDMAAERRLKLLRTPVEEEPLDDVTERRGSLLRPAYDGRPSVSHDTPPPAGNLPDDIIDGAHADIFLPPSSNDQSKKPSRIPAETLWMDVDTIREKRGAASAFNPRPTAPAVPQVLGRYQIERQLGESGFGSNYQALDTMLNRRVVIRLARFDGREADRLRARFHQEGRAAASLTHPSLAPVLDIGQAEGFDFLVMPLIDGESLQESMKRLPIWSVRQAVDLVSKLAGALETAHRQGFVHRDLKPSNILIAPSDVPIAVGFGQIVAPEHAQRTANAAYVAPEQLVGTDDVSGPASDIYSLGAILYQMLTGQLPPVATPAGLRLTFRADLDAKLQEICRKAMATDPNHRQATMGEFAQELSSFRQTLRTSEMGRLSPSALGRQPSAAPADASAPPMLGPVSGVISAAFAQMQQLRNLSEESHQPSAAPPRPGTQVRSRPFRWVIGLVIGVVVLGGAIFLVHSTGLIGTTPPSNNAAPGDDPNHQSPKTTAEIKAPQADTPEQLVAALKTANIQERAAAVVQLQQRHDNETADALVSFIANSEWSNDIAPKGETRDAAIAALLKVDPLKIQAALKRSAKSDDKRIRSWTYREIPRRIDADNDSVLRPVLLAGLRDADPEVRTLVVEQVRLLRNARDESVVSALSARVSDDLWGEAGNARADGGKKAALDALDELDSRRVDSALKQAMRSSNADVRKWAEQRKKSRED